MAVVGVAGGSSNSGGRGVTVIVVGLKCFINGHGCLIMSFGDLCRFTVVDEIISYDKKVFYLLVGRARREAKRRTFFI